MPRLRHLPHPLVFTILIAGATSGAILPLSTSSLASGGAIAATRSDAAVDIDDDLTHRIVELIDKDVRLDASQRAIAEALFDGYTQQFKDRSTAHRDLITSLYKDAQRVADRTAINERIHAENDRWSTARIALNNDLFESIKALLTQAQLERWPLVERDRRRGALLDNSPRFGAENIDLIDIADAVKIESGLRDVIDPTLNNWAEELDALLQARKAAQDQWAKVVEEPMSAGDTPDAAKKQEANDRLNQRSQAIRDLNVRYASLISAQLPAPGHGDFRAAFNRAAYPIIYRPTPADHYIASVLTLPDLSAEQGDAIANIKSDYDDRVLAFNDQLAVIMRHQEDADPNEATLKRAVFEQAGGVTFDDHGNVLIGNLNGVRALTVTRFAQPTDGGRNKGGQGESNLPVIVAPGLNRAAPESPQGRLEQSKRDLIQHTIDSVYALLNPDQQASLPRPTAEQMLSPEEKMRHVMEKAFSNAVITRNADGSVTFQITVEDESPSK